MFGILYVYALYMIHPLWLVCVVVRIFLALSLIIYSKYSRYIKLIILVIGLGFAYKGLTGSNEEIQFTNVFWHKTRLIHSFLYLLAYSMTSLKNSTIVLICDVIFSIMYRIYLENK